MKHWRKKQILRFGKLNSQYLEAYICMWQLYVIPETYITSYICLWLYFSLIYLLNLILYNTKLLIQCFNICVYYVCTSIAYVVLLVILRSVLIIRKNKRIKYIIFLYLLVPISPEGSSWDPWFSLVEGYSLQVALNWSERSILSRLNWSKKYSKIYLNYLHKSYLTIIYL